MSAITEKLSKWFSAIAFAEAGERETAMALVGLEPGRVAKEESALDKLNVTFAAAAFAEADCSDMALQFFQKKKRSASSFAASIGLKGVRVWEGVIALEEESFIRAVGLGGARLKLLTVRM